MAVVTELGSPNADSYVTASEVKAYAGDYPTVYPTVPSATDSNVESAARVATRFIDGLGRDISNQSSRYWPGRKASATQSRRWPRTNASYTNGLAIDDDVLPPELREATLIAACEEVKKTGVLQSIINLSKVRTKVKLGPGDVAFTPISDVMDARNRIMAVEDQLSELLRQPRGKHYRLVSTRVSNDTSSFVG